MKMRNFHTTVGLLFLIMAAVHFVRAINGTSLMVGETAVPVWASWLATVVGVYLAYQAYKLRS